MSNRIGKFKQSEGLTINNKQKWERRRNLGRVTLMEGIVDFEVDWDPICIVNRDLNGKHTVSGAMPDMLSALQDKLNFTRQLRAAPDQDYGSLNPDGTWTGIVSMLKDGVIDVSTAGLTITAERSEVVDFTLGHIADSATVIIRNPSLHGGDRKALTFVAYAMVFPISVWMLILATMTLFCLCYLALKPKGTLKWRWALNCLEGYALACLMLVQLAIEGSSLLWKSVAGKVLFCSLAYFGIVIYALYTSDLTAFITAPAQINLVKSFEVKYRFILNAAADALINVLIIGYHVETHSSFGYKRHPRNGPFGHRSRQHANGTAGIHTNGS